MAPVFFKSSFNSILISLLSSAINMCLFFKKFVLVPIALALSNSGLIDELLIGIVNSKHEPLCNFDVIVISPPRSVTMALHIDNPKPVPPYFALFS